MTMREDVLRRVRAANPVLPEEDLPAYLADSRPPLSVLLDGSEEAQPPLRARQQRPAWRRGPLVAAIAMGLALLVGVPMLLLRGGDGTVTLPATGGFSCPPGSTPDQPGPVERPRPPQLGYAYGATTFDPGSGRVLRLTMEGAFWTFDVCTNSWASAPVPEDIAGLVGEFVYDVDSDRFIAFAVREGDAQLLGDGGAQVWTYEPDGGVWTEKDEWAMGPVPEWSSVPYPQAVYDPVSGLVVVRESLTSAMWTYDVDTDTWTEIDQGTILPPAAAAGVPFGEDGTDWVIYTTDQILTYDPSVDRLILYVNASGTVRDISGTWEFDIRAGRWEEQDAALPDAGPGCGFGGPSGDEFAFDEANEVSVLFGGGTLATYDATEHTWTVLQQGSTAPYAASGERIRMCFAMTYDSVNERIVVLGGDVRILAGEQEMDPERDGWFTRDEVIAYDVATGEWITLLEPTSG